VESKRDYWKLITGETFEQTTRIPTFEETLDKQWQGLNTNYPLRVLGYGSEELTITEEERPHAHLIGSTGEGKSKFIEHLIRNDIARGFGVCLLDATSGARTLNEVLKWCCYNQIENVCLIDLHSRWTYDRIPGINPFLYKKEPDGSQTRSQMLRKTSVDSILDSIRILTATKDPATQGFINRYLPAVFQSLYNAQAPLAETLYFSGHKYIQQRREILSYTEQHEPYRRDLEEAFTDRDAYRNFQTTINRLNYFFHDPLGLVFGVDKGIDFLKLVRDKWVILVNLDASLDLDETDARLLGTMVINQVMVAIDRLFYKGYQKRYYLYIDEAGEYATRKLAKTFALKGKTGLRVTIGHQYFGQFEDKYVIDAINALTNLKAMFNLPGREDRDKITKMFYGGAISDRQASFANADIPKQHAVIKVGKGSPQRVKIPDVKTPSVSPEQLEAYIMKLYQQPWFYNPRAVQDKLKAKSIYDTPGTQGADPKAPRPRTPANRRPSRKAGISDKRDDNSKWKDVS
jgi:hypothetical protein